MAVADEVTTEVAAPPVTPVAMRPGRRSSFAPAVVAVIVLSALVLGGAAFITTQGDSAEPPTSDVPPGQTSVATTVVASTTIADSLPTTTVVDTTTTSSTTTSTTTTSTTTTTTTLPPDPRALALETIDATIDEDRPVADLFVGTWVPQVSAKREFEDWEGIVWGLPEILDLHERFDRESGAMLVSGAEYHFFIGDRRMSDYYFTFITQSFPNAEGALDWCRSAGINRDNCAARFISRGPTGSPTFVLQ